MTPRDLLTNPYFCPMPWTGLMYNFDGKIKNCIRSAGPIGDIKHESIDQILVGQKNASNQQRIIEIKPVDTCHTCYDIEHGKKNLDMISDRMFYIREFKNTSLDTYQAGQHNLQTIDVRWTNLCNFACVYCGPEFSSRWAEELKVQPSVPTQKQLEDFTQFIYDHASQLRHVYLAGGEPLLMKENLELLRRLNPDVNLRINTNLSRTETQIFDAICEFKNVHWTVSVESLNEQFEYIRYGGKWSEFLHNLDRIQQLDHRITFNMLWFLLNHESIFDCVDYLVSKGFHHNSFVIGALISPEHLNVRHLPNHVLQSLASRLESLINQQPGYLLEDSYRNMLHYIRQPFTQDLAGSFQQLQALDARRGLDSSKIFKELYKFREENKHG
jgi:sulfatase maturation enzyme AslB (radical SAM superfamily)